MTLKNALAAAVVATTFALVLASPADAAGQDGTADNNELIFFFNSGQAGSISDFAANRSDLAGYDFLKSGVPGYGQAVKNNAASVTNLRSVAARVYLNSGYAGVYDQVSAESSRNLVNTYNDNASFRWQ